MAPGWVRSAYNNGCNKWIRAVWKEENNPVYVRLLDVCGAVPNSTWGCNDIAFTKSAFVALAGSQSKAALTKGSISNVTWTFVKEPCVSCAEGLPGKNPFSPGVDTCKGTDSDGRLRPGRLALTTPQAEKICNDPSFQQELSDNVDGQQVADHVVKQLSALNVARK